MGVIAGTKVDDCVGEFIIGVDLDRFAIIVLPRDRKCRGREGEALGNLSHV